MHRTTAEKGEAAAATAPATIPNLVSFTVQFVSVCGKDFRCTYQKDLGGQGQHLSDCCG